MPVLPESNFLLALGWAILNSFWQMALLAGLFRLVWILHPGWKASSRTRLATLLVLTGFGWFLFTFFNALSQPTGATFFQDWAATSGFQNIRSTLVPLLPYAAILYLALLVIPIRQFIINYRYLRFIRQEGLTRIRGQWKLFTLQMAEYLEIKRPVQIWVSAFVKSPVTVGFLRPMILIPLAAVNHLDMAQMESVILHELAHIRRRDYLFNFLLTIIQSILYFNPFLRWLVRQIEEDRETSCDQWVIQYGYNAHSYATALVSLEKGWPSVEKEAMTMAMAATGNRSDLIRRIEQLIGVSSPRKWWTPGKIAGLAFSLLLLFMSQLVFLPVQKTNQGESISLHEWVASHFTSRYAKKPTPAESTPTASHLIQTIAQQQPVIKSEEPLVSAIPTPEWNNLTPADPVSPLTTSPFQYVNFAEVAAPSLTKAEQEDLKEVLEATKKVAREMEWESLKKQFGEALTAFEQEKLKRAHEAEFEKRNWKEVQEKLQNQYQEINWDKVYGKLDQALVNITMDSILTEINLAQEKVRSLEELMKTYKIAGIPDTDLNLENLKKEEVRLQKEQQSLRNIRNRKIVRL